MSPKAKKTKEVKVANVATEVNEDEDVELASEEEAAKTKKEAEEAEAGKKAAEEKKADAAKASDDAKKAEEEAAKLAEKAAEAERKKEEEESAQEQAAQKVKNEKAMKLLKGMKVNCPDCGTEIKHDEIRKAKDRDIAVKAYFDCPKCKTDKITIIRK